MKNNHLASRRRTARRIGVWAEFIAVWLLRLKFYRILARNYRIRDGEIDIIAQRGCIIAFVEVKARRDRETALCAIDRQKQHRISRAAHHWIARHPWLMQKTLRGDAIFIASRRLRLEHIPNFFSLRF